MGRNAAGESFMRGFLQHAKSDDFWLQVEKPDHVQGVAEALKRLGRTGQLHCIDKRQIKRLAEPGCVYYPGPGLSEFAWQRAAFGHEAWSLCGITHTTSSARAMDAIAAWIEGPIQTWDAVICTSTAVKTNVERVLQAQVDYVQQRLGASKIVLPQLPVIPLGVHVKDFEFTAHEQGQAREELGLSPKDMVVLFMGRLSFHAKAHPLPMYVALERAWTQLKTAANQAIDANARLVLIECGWHANDYIAKAYHAAAALAAPSVKVITLDGRESKARKQAWSSADIFCSLSDNIQETFGITPIEAMASGLPLIVSDWDGYKDTVRDGIDGFRISTWMPKAGLGGDLALRHALDIDTYDMYCGYNSSFVSVDIEQTTSAFVRLFQAPDLRKQMGMAARERARQSYDWSVVIRQYENLWAFLKEQRLAASPQPRVWPARLDPMFAFAAYPSQALDEGSSVQLIAKEPIKELERYGSLAMVNYANQMLPHESETKAMLSFLEKSPGQCAIASEIAAVLGTNRSPFGLRALVWLAKLGLIRLEATK